MMSVLSLPTCLQNRNFLFSLTAKGKHIAEHAFWLQKEQSISPFPFFGGLESYSWCHFCCLFF